MEAKHIKHLYNRIGFGITPNQIYDLVGLSKKEIVNQLFNTSKNTTPLTVKVNFNDLKDKTERRELVKKANENLKNIILLG